jgi:predicted Abi (CAAX) family protease
LPDTTQEGPLETIAGASSNPDILIDFEMNRIRKEEDAITTTNTIKSEIIPIW